MHFSFFVVYLLSVSSRLVLIVKHIVIWDFILILACIRELLTYIYIVLLKPDGDPKPTQNPMGAGAGVTFHPKPTREVRGRGWVFAPPDLNPTRCHPYR